MPEELVIFVDVLRTETLRRIDFVFGMLSGSCGGCSIVSCGFTVGLCSGLVCGDVADTFCNGVVVNGCRTLVGVGGVVVAVSRSQMRSCGALLRFLESAQLLFNVLTSDRLARF